jgi:SAM-dependent methyltransferase
VSAGPTLTTRRALEALPDRGAVLDVGVGAGAASLPFAPRAARIVGVDASEDLLAAFRTAAEGIDVSVETVSGRWPDVAGQVGVADVAVCAHVLYNVQDVEPFVRALDEHVRRRVVVEITGSHPLAWMNPLWLRFHRLHRPEAPTAGDALAVLRQLGIDATIEREARRSRGGFERREDAVAVVRKRLCLPADRDPEVAEALGPLLRRRDGLWSAGPPEQDIATLWWDRPER